MTTRNFRVNNGLEVGDIVISPTSNPLLTLKLRVVMVPYLPHDC